MLLGWPGNALVSPQWSWGILRRWLVRGKSGHLLGLLAPLTQAQVELWQHIWRGACRRQTGGCGTPHAPLADPPRIKALLREEVRLLLLTVRQKADGEGRDGAAAVSRYSCDVVRYAMACDEHLQHEAPSRPQSAQHQQDVRCHTNLEAMREKLRISNIDEIVDHVKSALKEECDLLRKDIQFLQACVEQEHQNNEPDPEPTLPELRRVRSCIEEDLKGASTSTRSAGWMCHPRPFLLTPQLSDIRGGRSATPPPNHDDFPPSRSSPALEQPQLRATSPWALCQDLQRRAPSRAVLQSPLSTPPLALDSNAAPAQHHSLGVFLPTPPVIQRPASRRRSSVRRLRLPQADDLVSIT
ncbi:coiled-coil domain-containing protein 24 isoform X2 [Brienomyrus brachyistius]|uniref:coiled-coil domain-containing protein 24 isoform X2 n=1 Tax=Brienomyrus brachyistius TaxID=42636 RepID=UPI0020B20D8D|nr:coiled-coil domain-containing protein 24 isoform X2 [Brienomyrus brachyistius]